MFKWYARIMRAWEAKVETMARRVWEQLPPAPPRRPKRAPYDIHEVYELIPLHIPNHRALRKARERINGGTFTKADWRRLLVRDKQCLCCGAIEDLTADHVIPIVKGGKNHFANMQVLCRSCNSSKGVKVIDYRKRG